MAKKNALVQITPTHEGNLNVKVTGVGEFVFDRSKTSIECRHVAEMKGWKFTLEDSAALSRDTETGKSATPEEKFAAIKAIADHYMSGVTVWGRARAAGGAVDDAGMVVLALARVKECDVDAANAMIERMMVKKAIERKAVLANLRTNPAIVKAVGEIRAERAAANKSANAADLLAEMDSMDDDDLDDTGGPSAPADDAPF